MTLNLNEKVSLSNLVVYSVLADHLLINACTSGSKDLVTSS